MGKTVLTANSLKVPKGITVEVNSRNVKVTGPRGTLTRSFKHLNVDIFLTGPAKNKTLKVEVWLAKKIDRAAIRTVISHIRNMITGVSKGYEYKMRFVYAHFPINVNVAKEGAELEIRNYLGEKMLRTVRMLPGVTVTRSEKAKDEISLTGNSIEAVSQSAASIQTATQIHNKDIRKFLDGIYVSEKGVLGTL